MQLLGKAIAEFAGSFALVFIGCGSVMVMLRFPGTIPAIAIPIIFGLTIITMIYAVGHISGAHFNPVVTLAFSMANHFPAKEILPYCLAQIAGGTLAMTILRLVLPR